MDLELERALCRDFPATYAALAKRRIFDLEDLLGADLRGTELITAFGIEHGDGWYGIVRKFAEAAEPFCLRTGAHVLQQKEKFGRLVVHLSGSDAEVETALREAEEESETTCEQCGAPATLGKSKSGWWSTRCGDCGSSAMRYLNRRGNVERFLHYIIEPRSPEDVPKWRQSLLRGIDDDAPAG